MRHWLRGGVEDEAERVADLMRFGIDETAAREFVSAQAVPLPEVFGVWPGNAEALAVFLRLKRQWRLHPFSGQPLGIDHAAIPSTLDLMGIGRDRWPALFEQISICEDTVLSSRSAR